MAQQTAVEFLVEKLYELGHFYYVQQTELIEDAKQMEKEQIIKANRDGVDMVIDNKPFISGQEYYNETYGKD